MQWVHQTLAGLRSDLTASDWVVSESAANTESAAAPLVTSSESERFIDPGGNCSDPTDTQRHSEMCKSK